MAVTDAQEIEKGAKYLLSILAQESPVRYSRFYDGSEDTSQKLADGIGIEEECKDWYCAERIIELAVYELSEQGIVETRKLDELLTDGERDYEIILTARGRQAHLENAKLSFWDAE